MLRRALVLLAILLAATSARADTLVPPKQVSAPTVPYPEGASGDAVVVVELVVAADGTVESAKVVDGEEPFAAAARVAAMDFRFEPATRDGKPIRSTIRAKIVFHPPVIAPTPTPAPTPTTPTPVAPKPPPPVEIVVEGDRKDPGQTTVGGGEVKILPGAFGDPFRMIEALPGVTPLISGLPFFYVRGSPPGNTGYLIDGVKVPMLFHLGAGPSVLAPGLIDRVDFHPGGYPARYGRFTGGIVAGETIGSATKARGEWNVRLFDASAMLEAPLGPRTEGLVAGRFGYPGFMLSLLSPEIGLQYWDYQTRVTHRLTERDRVSVFGFGAFDRLTQTRTSDTGEKETRTLFDTQFHRADARWDRLLRNGTLRVATTFMFDQSGIGEGDSRGDRFAVRMYGWGSRAELNQKIDEVLYLRAGADFYLEYYRLKALSNGSDGREQAAIFPTRADILAGTRADLIIKPTSRVEFIPGVRLDFYSQGTTTVPAVDPRLATRLKMAKGVYTITTLGVTHQTPSFIVPVPGLRLATLNRGLQEAFQMAQGVEFELPWKSRLTTTVFHNGFRNLSDGLAVCLDEQFDNTPECDNPDVRLPGRSYGLEVLLKRDLTERVGGWLAYTLSRSERYFRGRTLLSTFDRTHVLSLAMSVNLGQGWRFGGRFSYLTGRPATQTVLVTFPGPDGFRTQEVPIGQQRLPDFHRLDVRLEKRWTWEARTVAVVLEWFNAYLKKEAVDWRCSRRGFTAGCVPEEIGPVTIPSIGVEGAF